MNRWLSYLGTALVMLLAAAILSVVPAVPWVSKLASDPRSIWLFDWVRRTLSERAASICVAILLAAILSVLYSHSRSPRLLRRDGFGLMVLGLLYAVTPALIVAGQRQTDATTRAAARAMVVEPHTLVWVVPGLLVLLWARGVTVHRSIRAQRSVEQTRRSVRRRSERRHADL